MSLFCFCTSVKFGLSDILFLNYCFFVPSLQGYFSGRRNDCIKTIFVECVPYHLMKFVHSGDSAVGCPSSSMFRRFIIHAMF